MSDDSHVMVRFISFGYGGLTHSHLHGVPLKKPTMISSEQARPSQHRLGVAIEQPWAAALGDKVPENGSSLFGSLLISLGLLTHQLVNQRFPVGGFNPGEKYLLINQFQPNTRGPCREDPAGSCRMGPVCAGRTPWDSGLMMVKDNDV